MKYEARLIFTGDIMCSEALTEVCRTHSGFDYSPALKSAGSLLSKGDYCVGNLETPVAGESFTYTSTMYCFNSPVEFAEEVKRTGIHLVSMANNHCMDRNASGLFATLDSLDSIGLPHIGTYRSKAERDTPFIAEVKGIKVGFLSYTYGTNAFAHNLFLEEGHRFAVNLFQPEETLPGSIHLLNTIEEIGMRTEELYGRENDIYADFVAHLRSGLLCDIRNLRKCGADFVILLMHSGGQYNPEPDPFTRNLVDFVCREEPVDAIIGHHPHVPHVCEMKGKCPVAYSLGNFIYTPGSWPGSTANYGEYSVVPSLTLRKDSGGTELVKMTFSITKSINLESGHSEVVPLCDLVSRTESESQRAKLIEDNRFVVNKFRNTPDAEVEFASEYEFQLS